MFGFLFSKEVKALKRRIAIANKLFHDKNYQQAHKVLHDNKVFKLEDINYDEGFEAFDSGFMDLIAETGFQACYLVLKRDNKYSEKKAYTVTGGETVSENFLTDCLIKKLGK